SARRKGPRSTIPLPFFWEGVRVLRISLQEKTMKRRRLMLLLAVAVLGVVGWWFWFTWNSGPKYAGKSLNYWFRQYCRTYNGSGNGQEESREAIEKMGSNAIPFLVKEALSTSQDSFARVAYYEMLSRLPESWQMPQFVSRDYIRMRAAEAVRDLKPSAAQLL